MATVYIAPTGQGSADGTSEANAYGYADINSAESDAGNGGTILFLDGSYSIGNVTWDPNVTNFTYKSLNKHGATLSSSSSVTLRFGLYGDLSRTVNFEDFNITGAISLMAQSPTVIKGMKQVDTISHDPTYAGFYRFNGNWNISDSEITKDFNGSVNIGFNSSSIITGCTFVIKCSSVGSAGITNSSGPIMKNTIFMSDTSSAIADSVIDMANCTNCCIFQMHSNDTSGGTNNVFSDPLFVDQANADYRLRPDSPCINAGTAS